MNSCFQIEVPSVESNCVFDEGRIQQCNDVNHSLNDQLGAWKNKLNHNKNWDIAKRITNKYEFIFSSGYNKINLVKKKPLSRAYFKLWEILHDFNIIHKDVETKTAHIADGPGGFIECVCDYFERYDCNHQSVDGITLRSNDRKIPNWKVSKDHMHHFNIKLYDGSIYDPLVISKFVDHVGEQSVDFVTADGGFDFSADFNSQEKQCYRLMFCEVYIALRLQKSGGNFLLKVFDLFSPETITLIALCATFYERVRIIKPNTSRPANSEKYILFSTFSQDSRTAYDHHLVDMCDQIRKESFIIDALSVHNCSMFYNDLTTYNIAYTANQIHHLKCTLDLSKNINEKNKVSMIDDNLKLCKQWCIDYNINSIS